MWYCVENTKLRPNENYFTEKLWNLINHIIIQLMHTKNIELLKHIKIMEAAATCFGLQKNHHQGATASA